MKLGERLRRLSSRQAAVVVGLACLVCLLLGAVIGRHNRPPMSYLVDAAKALTKESKVRMAGEDAFVRRELELNYRKHDQPAQSVSRSIDTSRLPLLLTKVPLSNTGQFAASEDLVRGALTRVEESLMVMDKLGNIFTYRNDALKKMDYGEFPSNIGKSIVASGKSLPLSAVRALYIAYDPSTATLFVSLQKYNPASRHVRFNVSSLAIDRRTLARVGTWKTVFESEDIPDDASFRGATGGRMVVAGTLLYFTIGDYNFGQVPQREFELVAQDPSSSFGKVYEHDLATGKTRVKSVGHRNPQGMVRTRDGKLINTEHGPEGGDELNVVADGNNYGWPFRTHGTDYGTFTWPIKFKAPNARFVEPLYAWVPSAAISPIIQVDGFSDRWDGDLLVGSLKAQSLFRLRMFDNRIVFSEPIWIGHRIRDIVQMHDQIVLMTDDPALVFVRVDEQRLRENSKLQKNVEFIPALAKCLNCHHFGETNPSHLAPSLANIVGRRIASDGFQRYSEGLKKRSGVWDAESLARFIRNPGEFAPGTGMPSLGLSESETKEVVSALGSRSTK